VEGKALRNLSNQPALCGQVLIPARRQLAKIRRGLKCMVLSNLLLIFEEGFLS
jgi:hypothetical protein